MEEYSTDNEIKTINVEKAISRIMNQKYGVSLNIWRTKTPAKKLLPQAKMPL